MMPTVPKPKKKKTIKSMRHAVVKKTNRAMHMTNDMLRSNHGNKITLGGNYNLGQGGIATSTFLNLQKNAGPHRLDELLQNSLLSGMNIDQAGIDPHDESAVGALVCEILPQLSVDPRSIGGTNEGDEDKNNPASSNLLLQENGPNSSTPTKSLNKGNSASNKNLINECLISMQVGKFQIQGSTKHNFAKKKAKNKLRYVCIVRSTNRPLLMTSENQDDLSNGEEEDEKDEGENDTDDEDDDGYDTMFTEYNVTSQTQKIENESSNPEKKNKSKNLLKKRNKFVPALTDEEEISSFPYILCLAIHSDGTTPDIRKVISLSQLVSITTTKESNSLNNSSHVASNSSVQGNICLRFRSGDIIEVNTNVRSANENNENRRATFDASPKEEMRKERLLWSLLQIHSILCASVVERHVAKFRKSQSLLLPPLSVPRIDRAELQYLSTVNGFLSDSPTLISLLERQRMSGTTRIEQDGQNGGDGGDDPVGGVNDMNGRPLALLHGDNANKGDNVDGMAYDMMMGNYSRLKIFQNPEEEKDAADILNASSWQPAGALSKQKKKKKKNEKKNRTPVKDNTSNSGKDQEFDASTTADALTLLLEKRMRDLEAETCRRLIAWEDEKNRVGPHMIAASQNNNESVDVLSLASLFSTLESLDSELESMEKWLDERASIIKPLTDDCKEIEEENRHLEQYCRSYEVLSSEMQRLLKGLHIPDRLELVLQDPGAVLPFVQVISSGEMIDSSAALSAETNEKGIHMIYEAGLKLKEVLDRTHTDGGIHLRAISEKLDLLNATKKTFCEGLAMIVVRIMETLAADVVEQFGSLNKETDTHSTVLKKLKDTQQKFQTSFLVYKRILEIIALLQPDYLDSIRAGYSELVTEGILSKKRMKIYFHSLPMRSCAGITSVSCELKEYNPASFKAGSGAASSSHGENSFKLRPVNSRDIEMALNELLPLINREAYFTAVMFSPGGKKLDATKKKRNFEVVKNSVDHSTNWFRYYIARVLGISKDKINGQMMTGDPMLSLVASIRLAETMETYFDKEKKGNEQSLALAYSRFTIMGLKKGVEKQWVSWIEKEIKWIKTNAGVPPNGKRAGVFTSFLNFPSYLDHLHICFRAGRESSRSVTKLVKFKTISYYLQKMAGALFASLDECSRRETTDQQYAASVMRMENTYFFTQSIKSRGSEFNELFARQITAAHSICKHSMDTYLGWMIKREFKQLHSLFSSISNIRKEVGDADVPIHVPRATFVKTLQKESNREVMKEKISIIYSRMEKHLSEASRLLPVAWKALVKVLYEWFGRWEKLSTQCYKFVLEPSAIDMVKIAKAAGGDGVRKNQNIVRAPQKGDDHNNSEHSQGSRGIKQRKGLSSAAAQELDDNNDNWI